MLYEVITGFLVNRVLMPYLLEAMSLLDEGRGEGDPAGLAARERADRPVGGPGETQPLERGIGLPPGTDDLAHRDLPVSYNFV